MHAMQLHRPGHGCYISISAEAARNLVTSLQVD